MKENNRPLKIFSGLAAATAVLLAGVTYDRWLPGAGSSKEAPPAAIAVTVVPDPPKQEAPPPAPASEVKKPAAVPEFDTVRVEPSGEAIVAGTAVPGSEVTVKLNGQVVGKSIANNEGAWVVVPEKPLQPGTGELSVDQKAPGGSEVVSSEQTVAVAVPEPKSGDQPMVALLDPQAPAKVLQTPDAPAQSAGPAVEKSAAPEQSAAVEPSAPPAEAPATVTAGPAKLKVVLDSVDYNDKGDIVFSGRAGAGASVRVYVDNKPVGDAMSGKDGKWNWTGKSEIAPGGHALRVDQIDKNGKVLNRVEIPFMREEPERVVALSQPAPQPPAVSVEPPAAPAATAEAPAASAGTTAASEETTIVAAAPAAAPVKPSQGRVIIQPGNNLWKISRVIYGRGIHYSVIFQANRGQIRNPNRIYPGQIFSTPNATPPEQIDPKRKIPLTPAEGGVTLD